VGVNASPTTTMRKLRETLKASGKRTKGDCVAPILEKLHIPSKGEG
jgi:hypothetical protein